LPETIRVVIEEQMAFRISGKKESKRERESWISLGLSGSLSFSVGSYGTVEVVEPLIWVVVISPHLA